MSKYATKSYESLFGIILILLGISFIFDAPIFNFIWQVLVIIWGILNIRDKNQIYGIILIIFGGLFILDTLFKIELTAILTGFFISALGIKLLFNNLK